MGLMESKVTKHILRDKKLWRYMTLDKFIDLLSTNKLFFASVNSYESSDPFEGLLPKVILDCMKEVFSPELNLLSSNVSISEDYMNKKIEEGLDSNFLAQKLVEYEKIKDDVKKMPLVFEEVFFKTLQSVVVNCWHQNEYESEAMWKLYSENNKGIAIQTTVQDLIDSIADERVGLSKIKYIDFYDTELKAQDCIVDNQIAPLLKRKSFEHEQEVRLFFTPDVDYKTLTSKDYRHLHAVIDVDISKLISKIYISPYASVPYQSSVRAIANKFGIEDSKIIDSSLLKVDKYLTQIF
jgi:hypothetical protein